MKCKRCKDENRKVIAKGLCNRCYNANKRGYKTREEQLGDRNYMRNGLGVLTDKKGTEWVVDPLILINAKMNSGMIMVVDMQRV